MTSNREWVHDLMNAIDGKQHGAQPDEAVDEAVAAYTAAMEHKAFLMTGIGQGQRSDHQRAPRDPLLADLALAVGRPDVWQKHR